MIPSFEKRVRGFSIDTSLAFILIILVIGLPFQPIVQQILVVVILICVYLLPYIISSGQSFGKRIQKTKVVNLDGSDVSILRLFLRDSFKVLIGILTFGIYLVVCVFNMDERKQNRTIHDRIFNTMVINLDTKRYYKENYFNRNNSVEKRGL